MIKLGDPIRIIHNAVRSSITTIDFDKLDNSLALTTMDYSIEFYDLMVLLDDSLPIEIDFNENRIEPLAAHTTKKTTIISGKFSFDNIYLCLGRFDNNDPKIFL